MLSNSLANFLGVMLSHDLRISDLDYADDIAMLGGSFDDIQAVINQMEIFAPKIRMKINIIKTKLLALNSPQTIHN